MTAIPQSISIDYSMEPPYFFFWQFQFNFLVNGVLRYTWLSVSNFLGLLFNVEKWNYNQMDICDKWNIKCSSTYIGCYTLRIWWSFCTFVICSDFPCINCYDCNTLQYPKRHINAIRLVKEY